MKGKIIGYEAKGKNGKPVIMVEIENSANIAGLPMNQEVELKWQ